MNFVVREYIGPQIYALDGVRTILEDLKNEDDVQVGMRVSVPGLCGGYMHVTVRQGEWGGLYGYTDDEKLMVTFEFAKDDRACWVCGGYINTRGLKRLELSK